MWNSKAPREFPGKLESTNLSRDNLSREIGCTWRSLRKARCLADRRHVADGVAREDLERPVHAVLAVVEVRAGHASATNCVYIYIYIYIYIHM